MLNSNKHSTILTLTI